MDDLSSKIFNHECKFVLGVGKLSQLPQTVLPEVAFWGRSNVGKSSLINTMINRKNFVRVSKTPGRTKELNFFTIKDLFYMVDLPGYGYAKVSLDQKILWNELVVGYIQESKRLNRIFLLIDSRIGIKEIDSHVMDFLDSLGCLYQIVLTKIDKLSKTALNTLINDTKLEISKRVAAHIDVLAISSKERIGIDFLKEEFIKAVNPKVDI